MQFHYISNEIFSKQQRHQLSKPLKILVFDKQKIYQIDFFIQIG